MKLCHKIGNGKSCSVLATRERLLRLTGITMCKKRCDGKGYHSPLILDDERGDPL